MTDIKTSSRIDIPFPLKRYYLYYGVLGSVVFYVLLFMLFMNAERQALYDEYIHGVSEKARSLYSHIDRNFMRPHGINIDRIDTADSAVRENFRAEIENIVAVDFGLAEVKLFRADALTLYDHNSPENEGQLYASRSEPGFLSAMRGEISSGIEVEEGRRLMEAYLPIMRSGTGETIAILETYEDVTRFEAQVQHALKDALILPTIVFFGFNIALFIIVGRADKIIADDTRRLVTIRQNMEKYLSQSAVAAIYEAVSEKKELFRGERQALVIFFSDIRGFTSYSESTEPESVVQTLNELFQIQAEIIHRYGGVIDKFVGDEVMAVFPENREVDATQAAIDIIDTIHSNPNMNVTVGIGIHAGEAVVGSLGAYDRRDYTAIGDTINTGARICAACKPNCVYISAVVYECLPEDIRSHFTGHESLNLKGKAGSFLVYMYVLNEKKELGFRGGIKES